MGVKGYDEKLFMTRSITVLLARIKDIEYEQRVLLYFTNYQKDETRIAELNEALAAYDAAIAALDTAASRMATSMGLVYSNRQLRTPAPGQEVK